MKRKESSTDFDKRNFLFFKMFFDFVWNNIETEERYQRLSFRLFHVQPFFYNREEILYLNVICFVLPGCYFLRHPSIVKRAGKTRPPLKPRLSTPAYSLLRKKGPQAVISIFFWYFIPFV